MPPQECAVETSSAEKRGLSREDLLVLGLIVLTCLPALVFRYLPMTDLPQHLAIVAVLASPDDPGFSEYYTVEYGNTLYLLPYLMALGLSKLLGLELAMRFVVFLSMCAFPLGIWSILRAMSKPSWMAILALPFVYNRAFFWGFVNFNLGIGLALICLGLVISPHRSRGRDWLLAVLGLAVSTTHIYGMAFILGYASIGLLQPGRREHLRRFTPLLPAILSLGAWAVVAQGAMSFGSWVFLPLNMRLELFLDDVFGGYADSSESWILLTWLLSLMIITGRRVPTSRERWEAMTGPEQIFAIYAGLNLFLYFVLPHHTPTAKFVFFRHAALALGLLPLLMPAQPEVLGLRWGRWLTGLLAVIVPLTHWAHLRAFELEAEEFDAIVDALPDAPRLLPMNLDTSGAIMKGDPYPHFIAYAQARRGGTIATTFPQLFWNIPLRMREDLGRENTPAGFEFFPAQLYDPSWAHWYTHAVARVPEGTQIEFSPVFPFRRVAQSGAWHLYTRVDLLDEDEAP
jgi:hypothetical protein